MRKTFLLVLSLLFILPGCSSDSAKISKESYDAFVKKLESSSYTLDLESGYTISPEGVWTQVSWYTTQYQMDFTDDCYLYCVPGIEDTQCFAWIPYTGSEEGYRYYYCITNWCQTVWKMISPMRNAGMGHGWLTDYALLSYDENEKCYSRNQSTGDESTETISYYVSKNEIKEIAVKDTPSNGKEGSYRRYEITNIGTTVIRPPKHLY
jgi:hypothetical protein